MGMVRKHNVSRWQYGLISVIAFVALLELILAVYNFWNGQFWLGMNNLLTVTILVYISVFNSYELKRSHPVAYLAYILAALGAASLIVTWVKVS